MIKQILVLCTGNICRSPMAEALLKAKLADKEINIISAGLHALVGRQADPMAQMLMKGKGIDISEHRAQQIEDKHVNASDLIITMTTQQTQELEGKYPQAKGKVFRLGCQDEFDVIDPFKRIQAIFEQSLAEIEHGLKHWFTVL